MRRARRFFPYPFMSSDKPRSHAPKSPDSMHDACGENPRGLGRCNATSAWSSLMDDWWRGQAALLPEDLRRTMQASLDQSMAVWEIACRLSSGDRGREAGSDSERSAEEALGLWRPVFEALRDCERNMLPAPALAQGREYAAAYGAYVGEFAKINLIATQRIRDKLAERRGDLDFVGLHRMMLEEAEQAYLAHVSTDEFALCQARFINALFRYARAVQEGRTPAADE